VTQVADTHIGDLIEAVFRRHRRRYGYRRISEDLSDRGVTCAPSRIRRIMAQRGLRALQPKNFVPKTSDGRADRPSPNLLSGKPIPEALNSVWAGDITFIPTSVGWLYLAVVIDLCSRRVVGWSLADHMRSDLVLDALNQALGTRSPNRTIFLATGVANTPARSSARCSQRLACVRVCQRAPTPTKMPGRSRSSER
jgi:transposase InsO family protein